MTNHTFTPGQSVKHPARGAGQIATLIYAFPHRAPTEAWVDFPSIGKRLVKVRDLAPLPAPTVPALRLVEEGNVA